MSHEQIFGQVRKCMTPAHKEKEELEDINRDGRGGGIVWTSISDFYEREELAEPGIKYGRVEEALEEGQGPHRVIELIMMMVVVRFEVLVSNMKNTVSWDTTPCSLTQVDSPPSPGPKSKTSKHPLRPTPSANPCRLGTKPC
jgi:hypothetical protein